MFGVTFDTIRKQYENGEKNYNPSSVSKNKGNPAAFYNTAIYKTLMSAMFKGFKKFETGVNKEYYYYIVSSKGDYSKRKGGDVYQQMKGHAEFIKNYLEKQKNNDLNNSLLKVYVDLWDVLNNTTWKNAFRKAFEYSDKEGDINSIVSSFKFIYIATVVAFESIALKIVNFEFSVYSGLPSEKAILEIMQRHAPFIKNLVLPAINLICLANNTKNPLEIVNQIISDETAMKNKLKAKEAASGITSVESFSLTEIIFNFIKKAGGKVFEVLAKAATSGANSLGIPTAAFIILFSMAVYLIFFGIPTARLIIYYVNMHKVNIQKELELQAELLSNNILLLQEKLEKTTDPDERVRLQNIIARQIEILSKLQASIKKNLDDEYEASVLTEQQIEDDDKSTGSEVAASEDDSEDGGGFTVDI